MLDLTAEFTESDAFISSDDLQERSDPRSHRAHVREPACRMAAFIEGESGERKGIVYVPLLDRLFTNGGRRHRLCFRIGKVARLRKRFIFSARFRPADNSSRK